MTFPFLFGVMFGDIGHGAILLAFGVLLCLKEQEWRILPYLKLFTPHRYMILLMGFFSLYCGFIYNEYLSINLNIFGSCYDLSQAYPNINSARKVSQSQDKQIVCIDLGWIRYGEWLIMVWRLSIASK